jgi:hypothetical protein
MNRSAFLSTLFSIFIILCLCCPVNAAEDSDFKPDIIIKIGRIDQIMDIIDDLAASDPDMPMSSPSYILRSMLFGTEWIDLRRSIVIGINYKSMAPDQTPQMAALMPYKYPNEDFHLSYNAVSGGDHYILSLPPGQGDKGGLVSAQMENALVAASESKIDGIVMMELAASQMLKKADNQIQNFLLEMDKELTRQQSSGQMDTDITPEDAKKLIESLLDTAKQLEIFSVGVDLTKSELVIFSDAVALKDTDLASLFNRGPASHKTRMADYNPKQHINFKSASYDISGMLDFFNKLFGEFYKKMGLDLAGFQSIVTAFTGEMAGGMSFKDNGIDLELICVLADKNGPDFLKSTYLPWLYDYGKKVTAIYNKQNPGSPVKNVITKAEESVVKGNKVYGVKCELPLMFPDSQQQDVFSCNLRMTAIADMIITAPSDEKLQELIAIAKKLKKVDYNGPLMTMNINFGEYLNAVQGMMPEMQNNMEIKFPDMGNLYYAFDMNRGTLSSKYTMKLDGIRSMASTFRSLPDTTADSSMMDTTRDLYAPPEQQMMQPPPPQQKPKPRVKKEDTASFWLDKGLLYATYGNDKEAIKFFKKSLTIEPDNPSTLFNLGLSYSSLGQYEMAINALQQSVALSPENGDYYYGLGWVYLMKGDTGSAMKYIQTAADLGNVDAKNYLLKHQ